MNPPDSREVARKRAAWREHGRALLQAVDIRPRWPFTPGAVAAHAEVICVLLQSEANAERLLRVAEEEEERAAAALAAKVQRTLAIARVPLPDEDTEPSPEDVASEARRAAHANAMSG
jgi:hypothetical protein